LSSAVASWSLRRTTVAAFVITFAQFLVDQVGVFGAAGPPQQAASCRDWCCLPPGRTATRASRCGLFLPLEQRLDPGATISPLKMHDKQRVGPQAVGAVILIVALADGVQFGMLVTWFRGEPMLQAAVGVRS
jgi:hypothetical protein